MSLVALLISAGMAASPPVGPPVADAALDLDGPIGRLAEQGGGEDQWTIPVLDDPDEEEQGGAQLRLRLLKLKLRVPI